MTYRERTTSVAGATLWRWTAGHPETKTDTARRLPGSPVGRRPAVRRGTRHDGSLAPGSRPSVLPGHPLLRRDRTCAAGRARRRSERPGAGSRRAVAVRRCATACRTGGDRSGDGAGVVDGRAGSVPKGGLMGVAGAGDGLCGHACCDHGRTSGAQRPPAPPAVPARLRLRAPAADTNPADEPRPRTGTSGCTVGARRGNLSIRGPSSLLS